MTLPAKILALFTLAILIALVPFAIPYLSKSTVYSENVPDIVYISKAVQLDADHNVLKDVYNQVQAKDNNYARVDDNQYIRVTFAETLNRANDITLYARGITNQQHQSPSIAVYPVYTNKDGTQTEGPRV